MHVPYKGSGEAMKDHLAGVVELFFDGPTTADLQRRRPARVKLLAAAAETRIAALPDLPTMREQGYDIGVWGYLWFRMVADLADRRSTVFSANSNASSGMETAESPSRAAVPSS